MEKYEADTNNGAFKAEITRLKNQINSLNQLNAYL